MVEIVAIIAKGGVVMIPLLDCSLISLALTIERIIFWTKRSRRATAGSGSAAKPAS